MGLRINDMKFIAKAVLKAMMFQCFMPSGPPRMGSTPIIAPPSDNAKDGVNA